MNKCKIFSILNYNYQVNSPSHLSSSPPHTSHQFSVLHNNEEGMFYRTNCLLSWTMNNLPLSSFILKKHTLQYANRRSSTICLPPLWVIFLFHSVNYFACFGRIGERPTTINHARRAIAVFLRALKGGRKRENTSRVISTFALLPSFPAPVTAMRQFL